MCLCMLLKQNNEPQIQLQLLRREGGAYFLQSGPALYFMHSHITMTDTLIYGSLLWQQ